MRLITVVLHAAIRDAEPADVQAFTSGAIEGMKITGAAIVTASTITARTVDHADDAPDWPEVADLELAIEDYEKHGGRDVDQHRAYLRDKARGVPLSAARWARLHELGQQWRAGWDRQPGKTGTKRTKGAPAFSDTPEGKTISAEMAELSNAERHAAIMEDFPVWQEGQHTEFLDDDGLFWRAEVIGFDRDAGTVDVRAWPDPDFVASLSAATEDNRRTVTVEAIRRGTEAEETNRKGLRHPPNVTRPHHDTDDDDTDDTDDSTTTEADAIDEGADLPLFRE